MDIGRVDNSIKQHLLEACRQHVTARIAQSQQAIAAASEAAASDGRSSAGDKYETTREMMQQEIDRYQQSLANAKQMEQHLAAVDIRPQSGPATLGSLVETNRGTFFIAIGIGRLEVDGRAYGIVSPVSPIGAQLLGKTIGQRFVFNSQEYTVSQIA